MAIEEGLGLLALGYYLYLKGKTPETVQFDADAAARQDQANDLARLTVANKIVSQGTTQSSTDPRVFNKGTLLDGELIIGSLTPTNPLMSLSEVRRNINSEKKDGCAGRYGFEFVANLLAPQKQEALAVFWTGKWGFVVADPYQSGFQSQQPAWYTNTILSLFSAIATAGLSSSASLATWQGATTTVVGTITDESGHVVGEIVEGLSKESLTKIGSNARRAVTAYQAYDAQQEAKPPLAGELSIDYLLRRGAVVYHHQCNNLKEEGVWYRPHDIGVVCKTRNTSYDYCANNPPGQKWVNPCDREGLDFQDILCPQMCLDGSTPQPLTEPCEMGTTSLSDTVLEEGMLSQRFYWDGRNNLKEKVSSGRYVVAAWFEMVTGLGPLGEKTDNTKLIKVPTAWAPIAM